MAEQLPLIAPLCSFTNCGKDAVCGLQNKSQSGFHVNVCPEHFKQLTGKDWDVANSGGR